MANTEPGPSLTLTAKDLTDPTRINRVLTYIQSAIGQLRSEAMASKTTIVQTTVISGGGGGGGGSPVTSSGWVTLMISANVVTPDLSLGGSFKLVLNQNAQVTVKNPIFTGASLVAGMSFWLYIYRDGTHNPPKPAFGSAFASDINSLRFVIDPNTITGILFKYYDDLLWHVNAFFTGSAIS